MDAQRAARLGLCEHGRVRTVCPTCRPPSGEEGVAWTRDPIHKRLVKEVPEARVACATCGSRGTARAFVEDTEARAYLCRAHAAERRYTHVTYQTSGRLVEAQDPTPAHWQDVLRDSRATSIRGFARKPDAR